MCDDGLWFINKMELSKCIINSTCLFIWSFTFIDYDHVFLLMISFVTSQNRQPFNFSYNIYMQYIFTVCIKDEVKKKDFRIFIQPNSIH